MDVVYSLDLECLQEKGSKTDWKSRRAELGYHRDGTYEVKLYKVKARFSFSGTPAKAKPIGHFDIDKTTTVTSYSDRDSKDMETFCISIQSDKEKTRRFRILDVTKRDEFVKELNNAIASKFQTKNENRLDILRESQNEDNHDNDDDNMVNISTNSNKDVNDDTETSLDKVFHGAENENKNIDDSTILLEKLLPTNSIGTSLTDASAPTASQIRRRSISDRTENLLKKEKELNDLEIVMKPELHIYNPGSPGASSNLVSSKLFSPMPSRRQTFKESVMDSESSASGIQHVGLVLGNIQGSSAPAASLGTSPTSDTRNISTSSNSAAVGIAAKPIQDSRNAHGSSSTSDGILAATTSTSSPASLPSGHGCQSVVGNQHRAGVGVGASVTVGGMGLSSSYRSSPLLRREVEALATMNQSLNETLEGSEARWQADRDKWYQDREIYEKEIESLQIQLHGK